MAMKNSDGPAVWGRNLAEINIDIHNRILRTHSGNPALKHFDGSTMEGYRVPSIVFQAAFCKKTPTPRSCVEGVLKRRNQTLAEPTSDFTIDFIKKNIQMIVLIQFNIDMYAT